MSRPDADVVERLMSRPAAASSRALRNASVTSGTLTLTIPANPGNGILKISDVRLGELMGWQDAVAHGNWPASNISAQKRP